MALGSNLGDARANVLGAMEQLGRVTGRALLKSSLWETTPVDCPPSSPKFVNAVVAWRVRPGETPEAWLRRLQRIEKEFGRRPKKVLNEARPLDLDLIAFGHERRATRELTLPHPRAHERRFVLQPLSEMAPDLVLPGQMKTVAQLLASLPPDLSMKRLEGARAYSASPRRDGRGKGGKGIEATE